MADPPLAFFSYSRTDGEFALRLAEDLKSAGANIWIDQLDIEPGTPWDHEIEEALSRCPRMLVILSPASANSDNASDEVAFALNKHKRIIPVLYRECDVPLRLARLQYVDFTTDYTHGLKALIKALVAKCPEPMSGDSVGDLTPTEGEKTYPFEVGKTYLGNISRLVDSGAFVEIEQGVEGFMHISEVAEDRIADVRDELKEGDQVLVKVLSIQGNRIELSRKAIFEDIRKKQTTNSQT